MLCPECKQFLTDGSNKCGCGWGEKSGNGKSQGIGDCEWVADSERCHYPGTISQHTNGTGPFYCCFHATSCSAAYGARVVAESRNYQPRSMAERDHDVVFGKYTGPKACKERTCIRHAIKGMDYCIKHAEGVNESESRQVNA